VEAVVVPPANPANAANVAPLQRSLSVPAASEGLVDLAPIQAATDATSLGVLAEAVEEFAAAEALSSLSGKRGSKAPKRGGRRTKRVKANVKSKKSRGKKSTRK
jgi:hypothetical protein